MTSLNQALSLWVSLSLSSTPGVGKKRGPGNEVGLSVKSNSPFLAPNMLLRVFCKVILLSLVSYQNKAQSSQKLNMAIFLSLVVPSP